MPKYHFRVFEKSDYTYDDDLWIVNRRSEIVNMIKKY